jgi:hypothetical protein
MKNGVFWVVTPWSVHSYILEDAIIHTHRRENLKSYMMFYSLLQSSDWRQFRLGSKYLQRRIVVSKQTEHERALYSKSSRTRIFVKEK